MKDNKSNDKYNEQLENVKDTHSMLNPIKIIDDIKTKRVEPIEKVSEQQLLSAREEIRLAILNNDKKIASITEKNNDLLNKMHGID